MKFISHFVIFRSVFFANFIEHLGENILSVPVRPEIRRQIVEDIVVLNLQCLETRVSRSVHGERQRARPAYQLHALER